MKLRPTTNTTMNLSDNTLGILKNFAGINNSILVKEGNQTSYYLSNEKHSC